MEIRIEAARGEDRFSMSHGSFRYRRKTGRKRRLSIEEAGLLVERLRAVEGEQSTESVGAVDLEEALKDGGTGLFRISMKGLSDRGFNRYFITLPTAAKHFYGCGETYSALDLAGEKVRIWVAEHQNSRRIGKKLIRQKLTGVHPDHVGKFSEYESYFAMPVFVTDAKEFVYVKTDRFAVFDFSVSGQVTVETEEAPFIILGRGETYRELSELLSSLLGRPPVLPDWANEGAILAVQEGPERIEEKLAAAEKAGAKVVGVWSQDWCGCRRTGFGYQVMWNWEYDRELYHDLPDYIAKWWERGIRFLGYINPFIALEKDLYREAHARGYCVKNAKGEDYQVTITTFPAAMVDFTNPAAYAWYKNLIKQNMIGIGMGGWMADFGEYLPTDCVLFSGEDPAVMHNRWPSIWAKLNREAVEESGKLGEVFFFTRAGFTGTVKDSLLMWTGDQHVDWSVDDGLPSVIPATLSLAMSGYPIAHSDVGGYTTVMDMTRSKELLQRWEEMNTFSPLFRFHEGNQPSRNVQFDGDEELLRSLALASNRHAALAPYLRVAQAEAARAGTPVMRPLFYEYPDGDFWGEATEYLLGRDLLVAPVLREGAVSRTVRLPDDAWLHLWTGREYSGGSHEIAAPIGSPPVFVRKGADMFTELMEIGNI